VSDSQPPAPGRGGWFRFVRLWGPALAAMAAIFVASSMSTLPPAAEEVSDKTLHFAAYATLGLLVLRAMAGGEWRGVTAGSALRAWLLTVAYGASDELHQAFVPNRWVSLGDWLADAAGAGLAIVVALVWAMRGRTRRSL
jgi:VanZ family protein